MLDAEEVRGSNPLAPTDKDPGHRAFSFRRTRQDPGRKVDEKLTRRARDELDPSAVTPQVRPEKAVRRSLVWSLQVGVFRTAVATVLTSHTPPARPGGRSRDFESVST